MNANPDTPLFRQSPLLPPTAGTAVVAGHDVTPAPADVRRKLRYIGQGNGTGHYHHVRDEVVMHGRAYGLGGGACTTAGR